LSGWRCWARQAFLLNRFFAAGRFFALLGVAGRCWSLLVVAGCCCWPLAGVHGRFQASPSSCGHGCGAGLAAFGRCWALLGASTWFSWTLPTIFGRCRASSLPGGLDFAVGLAGSGRSRALLGVLWAGWVVLWSPGRTVRIWRAASA